MGNTRHISTDLGETFLGPLQHVEGDVEGDVEPGVQPGLGNTITWDLLSEFKPSVNEKCVLEVRATGLRWARKWLWLMGIGATGATGFAAPAYYDYADTNDPNKIKIKFNISDPDE